MNTVTLEELLTPEDIRNLTEFVSSVKVSSKAQGKHIPSTANIIMKWIEDNKKIRKVFVEKGILKAYGAYLIQYLLGLE